jgi:hypothetical protein
LTVHAGPVFPNTSVIWTGCPAAYVLWSVLTLATKSLQTHPGGSGAVVVAVVAGVGAGAGGTAGVNVLALVLTAGAVVVVVAGDGCVVDVAGVVLTRATAA